MSEYAICSGCFQRLGAVKELEAENTALVEALEKLARLGNGDHYGNSDGNVIAQKALLQSEGEI
ncbi:MAG: hypothetical protein DRR06_19460 [Gammaproteobacteria bacterium]|nr:MAG: hypothetical protein DRR06_19460 [Gammaproteobacteria bacterium]